MKNRKSKRFRKQKSVKPNNVKPNNVKPNNVKPNNVTRKMYKGGGLTNEQMKGALYGSTAGLLTGLTAASSQGMSQAVPPTVAALGAAAGAGLATPTGAALARGAGQCINNVCVNPYTGNAISGAGAGAISGALVGPGMHALNAMTGATSAVNTDAIIAGAAGMGALSSMGGRYWNESKGVDGTVANKACNAVDRYKRLGACGLNSIRDRLQEYTGDPEEEKQYRRWLGNNQSIWNLRTDNASVVKRNSFVNNNIDLNDIMKAASREQVQRDIDARFNENVRRENAIIRRKHNKTMRDIENASTQELVSIINAHSKPKTIGYIG